MAHLPTTVTTRIRANNRIKTKRFISSRNSKRTKVKKARKLTIPETLKTLQRISAKLSSHILGQAK
jgi:hypothetical protein